MDIIKVTNIRVYAYHGCLSQETKIGSDYLVNVSVQADLSKSAASDELNDTVDYVFLNQVVKEEMAIPSKLLETVGSRILQRFLKESPLIKKATVAISKLNPPIGGDVEMVSVKRTLER